MAIHIISESDHDIRLDRWFKRHHAGYPHSMLEKNIRHGDIRINGKRAKTSDRLQQGQELEIRCALTIVNVKAPKIKIELTPYQIKEMQGMVLFKDKNLMVINKPAGLAVQGGTGIKDSVDSMLGALQFDSPTRPKLVHRLDKETSGVLVLARNAKVASELMHLFADKTIDKTYIALVHNQPEELRGTIDQPLMKIAEEEGGFEKIRAKDEGKRAITEYRVVDMLARKFSVMELKPLTGRTHQLRVHMAEIGCPIVGDDKYGGRLDFDMMGVDNRLHLHAQHISIPPLLGAKAVNVSAPLPKHMAKTFKTLGISLQMMDDR